MNESIKEFLEKSHEAIEIDEQIGLLIMQKSKLDLQAKMSRHDEGTIDEMTGKVLLFLDRHPTQSFTLSQIHLSAYDLDEIGAEVYQATTSRCDLLTSRGLVTKTGSGDHSKYSISDLVKYF